MLSPRATIIAEARSWLGTPFQHQAMLKGVGVDCVGLVIGVGLAAGVLSLDRRELPRYGRLPNPRMMGDLLERYAVPVAEWRTADIPWVEWREGLPMHLGIIGEANGMPTIIHAAGNVGRVVEQTFTSEWEERTVSFWRYPGVLS